MCEEKINRKNLLEFIRDFNHVTHKYGLKPDHFKSPGFDVIYKKLSKHELHDYPMSSLPREYSVTYENVKLIYTKEDVVRDMMELCANTRENVVRQFINISGIERLFSEKYFDYEWDMHTRIKYNDASHDAYRDHFIHQIRNFYSMMTFLDDDKYNFPDEAIEEIKANKNDVIPSYIHNAVNSSVHDILHSPRELILYLSVRSKLDFNDEESERFYKRILDNETEREKFNDYLYKTVFTYLIKLACAMTSLFHDIGYPINHNLRFSERLTEYISLLYNFSDEGSNFNRMASLLDSSLLFKIIPHSEIKQRLGKKDHGALSAVTFLLHFYENGSSDGFHDTVKRAAAEIAAIAMYDHTIQYRVANKEDKSDAYFKPYYKKNPVSVLFRLCDDLQEWDRVYYDYKYTPAMQICDICKTPILSVKIPGEYRQLIENEDLEWKETEYKNVCLCSKNRCGVPAHNCYGLVNVDFPEFNFKRDSISDLNVQKIIIVNFCDQMTIEQKKKQDKDITINLRYNPYKLLQMCCTSAMFTKYRIEDIIKLKKLLDGQFSKTNVKLDYFITSNPLLLKARVIEDYIEKYKCFIAKRLKKWNYNMSEDDIKRIMGDNISEKEIGNIIDKIYKRNDEITKFFLSKYRKNYEEKMDKLKGQIKTRYNIYKAMNHYYKILIDNSKTAEDAETHWNTNVLAKVYKTQPIDLLLFDAKVQYNRLAHIHCGRYKENYYSYINLFQSEYEKDKVVGETEKYKNMDWNYFFSTVNAYCSPEVSPYPISELPNGKLPIPNDKVLLDFYTDMALYQKISKDTENMLKFIEKDK